MSQANSGSSEVTDSSPDAEITNEAVNSNLRTRESREEYKKRFMAKLVVPEGFNSIEEMLQEADRIRDEEGPSAREVAPAPDPVNRQRLADGLPPFPNNKCGPSKSEGKNGKK